MMAAMIRAGAALRLPAILPISAKISPIAAAAAGRRGRIRLPSGLLGLLKYFAALVAARMQAARQAMRIWRGTSRCRRRRRVSPPVLWRFIVARTPRSAYA